MGMLDDFYAQVQDAESTVQNDIYAHVKAQIGQPLVINGLPQLGNQNAAQIAAGQPGNAPPVSNANATKGLAASTGVGWTSMKIAGLSMPVVIIGVVAAYFLIFKKGRA